MATSNFFVGLERNAYAALLIDPPWKFKARSAKGEERSPCRHYDLMGLDEIRALPIAEIARPDSHLFLWVPGPFLHLAFDIMHGWGFRYSSMAFVWVKLARSYDARQLRLTPVVDADLHIGLGLTTRKNAEFCLLARRGKARRMAKDVREIILAPVRDHSRKPDEALERIERYCAGPYCELFARGNGRPGWAVWGREAIP